MKNKIIEILESDFDDSRQAFLEAENSGDKNTYAGGDVFNRHDYSNFYYTALEQQDIFENKIEDLEWQLKQKPEPDTELIKISNSELWCLITAIENCSGEDFDPLTIRLRSIRDSRIEALRNGIKTLST